MTAKSTPRAASIESSGESIHLEGIVRPKPVLSGGRAASAPAYAPPMVIAVEAMTSRSAKRPRPHKPYERLRIEGQCIRIWLRPDARGRSLCRDDNILPSKSTVSMALNERESLLYAIAKTTEMQSHVHRR